MAANITREPAAVARIEPRTGPTTHPGRQRHPYDGDDPVGHGVRGRFDLVMDRGEQLLRGQAAPEKARTTALITKGIHTRSAKAIATHPRNPARAHHPEQPEPLSGAVPARADQVASKRER